MMQADNPWVIVVDDEGSVRQALESLLRSSGQRVTSFASAEEFLQSASPDGVGCLIIDVHLPGMSGLDLQQRLAIGEWQHVPIVIMTAREDGNGRSRARALETGARAFLLKPLLDDGLLDAVRSALEG